MKFRQVVEALENSIEFQINKHGQHCGYTSAEDYINSLSNYELLKELMLTEPSEDSHIG